MAQPPTRRSRPQHTARLLALKQSSPAPDLLGGSPYGQLRPRLSTIINMIRRGWARPGCATLHRAFNDKWSGAGVNRTRPPATDVETWRAPVEPALRKESCSTSGEGLDLQHAVKNSPGQVAPRSRAARRAVVSATRSALEVGGAVPKPCAARETWPRAARTGQILPRPNLVIM